MHATFSAAGAYWAPAASAFTGTHWMLASPGLFRVLRVPPRAGTLPSRRGECVVSTAYWQSNHARISLGQNRIELLGGAEIAECTVTGVMPPIFDFPEGTDVWVVGSRAETTPFLVARLRAGVSPGTAAIRLADGTPAALRPLRQYVLGDRGPTVAIVFLLSLASCALATLGALNLLLARNLARRRELAVRLALGMPRKRLAVILLAESLGPAAAGVGFGLLLSQALGRLLLRWAPESLGNGVLYAPPRIEIFVAILAGVTVATLSAVPPILQAFRIDTLALLAGRGGWNAVAFGPPDFFVAAQLTLALVLLPACIMLQRSVHAREGIAPGFDPTGVAVLRLEYPPPASLVFAARRAAQQRRAYPGAEPQQEARFREAASAWQNSAGGWFRTVLTRIAALPGVIDVSAIAPTPFDPAGPRLAEFYARRAESRNHADPILGRLRYAAPGAVGLLRIPLLAGRDFRWGEGQSVALVSRALANRLAGNGNALGRDLWVLGSPAKIIGVVGDIHDTAQDPADAEPSVYLPINNFTLTSLLVRLRSDRLFPQFGEEARVAVRRTDPALSPPPPFRLRDRAATPWQGQWLALRMSSLFSAVALITALLGVWSSTRRWVAMRELELAVRAAYGARSVDLLSLACRSALRVFMMAAPFGVGGGWLLARVSAHLFYQTSPTDVGTYATAIGAVLACALVTCGSAARRAIRSDPAAALRRFT